MFLQKPSGFNLIGAVCLGSMQRLLFSGFQPFLSVKCWKMSALKISRGAHICYLLILVQDKMK